MNEIPVRNSKISQSIMFLPYFISWVVGSGQLCITCLIMKKGLLMGFESYYLQPFDLYNTPKAWPFVLIFLRLWKQTGYGSVVYLAAITGLDQEMYEAKPIDGASQWQKIRYLTIPS